MSLRAQVLEFLQLYPQQSVNTEEQLHTTSLDHLSSFDDIFFHVYSSSPRAALAMLDLKTSSSSSGSSSSTMSNSSTAPTFSQSLISPVSPSEGMYEPQGSVTTEESKERCQPTLTQTDWTGQEALNPKACIFSDRDVAFTFAKRVASHFGFRIRIKTSSRNRRLGIVFKYVCCKREGHPEPSVQVEAGLRTGYSVRCGCRWLCKLVGVPVDERDLSEHGLKLWFWDKSERESLHNHDLDFSTPGLPVGPKSIPSVEVSVAPSPSSNPADVVSLWWLSSPILTAPAAIASSPMLPYQQVQPPAFSSALLSQPGPNVAVNPYFVKKDKSLTSPFHTITPIELEQHHLPLPPSTIPGVNVHALQEKKGASLVLPMEPKMMLAFALDHRLQLTSQWQYPNSLVQQRNNHHQKHIQEDLLSLQVDL